jgi:hypothetical protein
MKTIILSILGGMAATAGVGYVAVEKPQRAELASLRVDNAQLAGQVNSRNAAIDAAIKLLQEARK